MCSMKGVMQMVNGSVLIEKENVLGKSKRQDVLSLEQNVLVEEEITNKAIVRKIFTAVVLTCPSDARLIMDWLVSYLGFIKEY